MTQGGEARSDVHAHHLIGQQGDHAEHQMTEHFPIDAHPDMLRLALVLEAAEEAFHRRALPHARRFPTGSSPSAAQITAARSGHWTGARGIRLNA